jgi:hypothetical protein
MSSDTSQNNLIQFTAWLGRKLMWGILILLCLGGLAGAGFWLTQTDATHVILKCEWQHVDEDNPTGDLTSFDRHYILKKERFGNELKALWRPKLELADQKDIKGIGFLYSLRYQDEEQYLFGLSDESVQHVFMRKTGELFFRDKKYNSQLDDLAEGNVLASRLRSLRNEDGWTKASACEAISQSDLKRIINSKVEEVRSEQKF